MGHKCKDFDRALKIAKKNGFKVNHKGERILITPPDPSQPVYNAHNGGKSYHPVRRYLKSMGIKC